MDGLQFHPCLPVFGAKTLEKAVKPALTNFPNPFNETTRITYTLPSGGQASLTLYDSHGRLVRTITDKFLPAGRYDSDFGVSCMPTIPGGIYLLKLTTVYGVVIRKLLITR